MSRCGLKLLVLWLATALCPAALGGITAYWQPVPITPAAIAENPQLAQMQNWDLMTTTSGNWVSAAMLARLPTGLSYYKHPLGGRTRPDPALFGSSPALEFTTYASAATDDGTNQTTLILGGVPQSAPPSIGDLSSPIPGNFGLAWGNNPPLAPPGTHQIARLTFPQGVLPELVFNPESGSFQVNPDTGTPIPPIPEPSILGLVGAVVALALRRRCSPRSFATSSSFEPLEARRLLSFY